MTAPAPTRTADLGRYEVLFRLASGGMAEVFVARQSGEAGFERVVAIKRMLAHLADDERFVDMFLDEARLAANISSPHVVQTLDIGVDDQGSPFIVMDLVRGLTLAQTLRAAAARKGFVPVPVAVEILAQAADGLHDAHEARTPAGIALQIVHRDVSPQNVLIGVDGRVRIMDFGVARALARITKTSTGEFKGKIAYFSPQQAEGKEIDRRSDIFSHGIVAWETFVGARLFKNDNPLAVLDAIRSHQIPLVSELRPDVPEAVAKVVAKALDRDVDARYQTARDFSRDLRKAAESTLDESPDPRLVSAYIKDISGGVLDNMQQRISEAFSRASQVDAEGRLSLASSPSRIRFAQPAEEVPVLTSEPPAALQQDEVPRRAFSDKPTMIETGASQRTPRSAAQMTPTERSQRPLSQSRTPAIIIAGGVALVAALGGLFMYMRPKEVAVPAETMPPQRTQPSQQTAPPAEPTKLPNEPPPVEPSRIDERIIEPNANTQANPSPGGSNGGASQGGGQRPNAGGANTHTKQGQGVTGRNAATSDGTAQAEVTPPPPPPPPATAAPDAGRRSSIIRNDWGDDNAEPATVSTNPAAGARTEP